MTKLGYSLVIEATNDPNFFGFYSPDLKGFTGTGRSIPDCITRAAMAMDEFVSFLRQEGLPIPKKSAHATILIENDDKVMKSMMDQAKRLREFYGISSESDSRREVRVGRTGVFKSDPGHAMGSHHSQRIISNERADQKAVHRKATQDARKMADSHGRKRKTNNRSKRAA